MSSRYSGAYTIYSSRKHRKTPPGFHIWHYSGGVWRRMIGTEGLSLDQLKQRRMFLIRHSIGDRIVNKCDPLFIIVRRNKPKLHPYEYHARRVEAKLKQFVREGDESISEVMKKKLDTVRKMLRRVI